MPWFEGNLLLGYIGCGKYLIWKYQNQLPPPLRHPRLDLPIPDSSVLHDHLTSPVSSSPLLSFITPSFFFSNLKTFLFLRFYPPYTSGTSTDWFHGLTHGFFFVAVFLVSVIVISFLPFKFFYLRPFISPILTVCFLIFLCFTFSVPLKTFLAFFSLRAWLNWPLVCQFSSADHLSYRIICNFRSLFSRFYTTTLWKHFAGSLSNNNSWQVVHTHVPLSPSSIIWYRARGGDALRLSR